MIAIEILDPPLPTVLNELQIVPCVWSKVVTDLSENKGESLNFVKMSKSSGDFKQNLDTCNSLFLVTFSEKAATLSTTSWF